MPQLSSAAIYLAKALGGSDDAALDEKKCHDKALKEYQAAYNKYTRQRTHHATSASERAEVL